MMAFLRDRLVIIWLLLIAVTLLSSRIGGADGLAKTDGGTLVTALVLAIACGKVAAVMFAYMNVQGAPRALKLLCTIWLLSVFGVLMAIYLGHF